MPMPKATVAVTIRAEPSRNDAIAIAPGTRREAGVVHHDVLAGRSECVACSFGTGVRGGVHDPRALGFCSNRRQFTMLLVLGANAARREGDVRSIEVSDNDLGIAQAQPPHDLMSDRRRSRCRQCHAHGHPHRLSLCAEAQVVGSEVVPPLADQVRLVDDEQSRPRTLQHLPRPRVAELLRGEEDERIRTAGGCERCRVLVRRLM